MWYFKCTLSIIKVWLNTMQVWKRMFFILDAPICNAVQAQLYSCCSVIQNTSIFEFLGSQNWLCTLNPIIINFRRVSYFKKCSEWPKILLSLISAFFFSIFKTIYLLEVKTAFFFWTIRYAKWPVNFTANHLPSLRQR